MPLRIAVTGGAPSPDLDLTLFLVGREATLRRIDRAIDFIRGSVWKTRSESPVVTAASRSYI